MELFGISNYPAFLLAGILLNLTPGSDTFYILARSLAQGRGAGVLSALGISTGAFIHTIAAAAGLSVLLANSATLFHLVKFAGALYLVYLGIQALRGGGAGPCGGQAVRKRYSRRHMYLSGILTNVLNPKVALFFLAFLPQFVSSGYAHPALSFAILGATFITTGTIWCLMLALFAGSFSSRLTGGRGLLGQMHRITGGVFIALGISLAFSRR